MALDVVVCVLFVLFGIGMVALGAVNGGLWLALVAVGALFVVLGLVGSLFAIRGRANDRIKRQRGY